MIERFADAELGQVELTGTVEAMDLLNDPITGEPCVVIEYRAWPPTTTLGIGGGLVGGGHGYVVHATQAVDFLLNDGSDRALIKVERGQDIVAIHGKLTARHGIELHTERRLVRAGTTVRVAGTIAHRGRMARSPHRREPHLLVIEAHRIGPG